MEIKDLFKKLDNLATLSTTEFDKSVKSIEISSELSPLVDTYYLMNRFFNDYKYKLTKEDKKVLKVAGKRKVYSLCKSALLRDFIDSYKQISFLQMYGEWLLSAPMTLLLGAIAELACITIVGIVLLLMWVLLPISLVVTPLFNLYFFSPSIRLKYFAKHKQKVRGLSYFLCISGFKLLPKFFGGD